MAIGEIKKTFRKKLPRNKYGDVDYGTGKKRVIFNPYATGGSNNGDNAHVTTVRMSKNVGAWNGKDGHAYVQDDQTFFFGFEDTRPISLYVITQDQKGKIIIDRPDPEDEESYDGYHFAEGAKVEILDNGTEQTSAKFSITDQMTQKAGTVLFYVYTGWVIEYTDDDAHILIADHPDEETLLGEYAFSWSVLMDGNDGSGTPGTSPWTVQLTSDSANVPCNVNGGLLVGRSEIPTTTATLWHGDQQIDNNDITWSIESDWSGCAIANGQLEWAETPDASTDVCRIIITARYDSKDYSKTFTISKSYQGKGGDKGGDGQSNFYLDLSNETAGINVDADGNIIEGAVRPTCKATLYYGGKQYDGDCTYDIVPPTYGVEINWSSGEMFFDDFDFDGNETVEIKVQADFTFEDEAQTLYKVMTVSMNKPGPNGEPAVTRWITLSTDAIVYDPNKNNECKPNIVTATVWKQVGGDAPVPDPLDEHDMRYDWNWDGSGATKCTSNEFKLDNITKGNNYNLGFGLTADDGQTYFEIETIPFIADGKNGTDGDDGKDADPNWALTISNDIAGVNCDKEGGIIGALPTCTAKLYYGKDLYAGAIDWSLDTDATGVYIDSEDYDNEREIIFSENFAFEGDSVEIKVQAVESTEYLLFTKVMTIFKIYPTEDGKDAENKWLVVDPTDVMVDVNNTYPNGQYRVSDDPIHIYAKKQVGANPIEAISDTTHKYRWRFVGPDATYHEEGEGYTNEVTGFKLKTDTPKPVGFYEVDQNQYVAIELSLLEYNVDKGNWTTVDTQTIRLNRSAETGQQGRTGAAVRGPVEWTNEERLWCSGEYDPSYSPRSEMWIDIVMVPDSDGNPHYYRCKTTYQGKSTDTWAHVKNNWEQADGEFKFIATDLLLSKNAKIDFLTGSEIYLKDKDSDVITAGALSGNEINFFAGSNKSSIAYAPFRVYNDGTMVATKGTFGIFNIGKDEYGRSKLTSYTIGAAEDNFEYTLTLEPNAIVMEASDPGDPNNPNYIKKTERLYISPYYGFDDQNGRIGVECDRNANGFYTSGWAQANSGFKSMDSNFQWNYAVMSKTNGLKIEIVRTMPSNPDSNTLYIVTA